MTTQKFDIFGIIGGDRRQLYLAKLLEEDGREVLLAGFDKAEGVPLHSVRTAVENSDAVILPLPSLRADGKLNTPLSAGEIVLDDTICAAMSKKPIFAAGKARLVRTCPVLEKAEIYDYAAREDFAVLNALPTAEGALECAMSGLDDTVSGSRCLVAGFGKIGKVLCRLLHGVGANVSAAARKPVDLAFILALGYEAVDFKELNALSGYDVVFNTVPARIFDRALLGTAEANALIIDLASLPGGVDIEAARDMNLNAVRALALPGKCAPKAAGKIIKETIFNIIKEVYG